VPYRFHYSPNQILPFQAVGNQDFEFLSRAATPRPVQSNDHAETDISALYDEDFGDPVIAEDESSDDIPATLTRQDAVDGRRPCALHYEYTLLPRESSVYCILTRETVLEDHDMFVLSVVSLPKVLLSK
jgi:hypothetical protein